MKEKKLPNRYCLCCERIVAPRECPFCGADTDPLPNGLTDDERRDLDPSFRDRQVTR